MIDNFNILAIVAITAMILIFLGSKDGKWNRFRLP